MLVYRSTAFNALVSAVSPCSSVRSTSAPATNNDIVVSQLPISAAKCNAVSPSATYMTYIQHTYIQARNEIHMQAIIYMCIPMLHVTMNGMVGTDNNHNRV